MGFALLGGGRKPCFNSCYFGGHLFGLDEQLWTKCKSSTFISIFIISSWGRPSNYFPADAKPCTVVRHIMKTLLFIAFIFLYATSSAQEKRPEDFGFRYLQTIYKGDTVNILVKSKKGEESKSKPLFIFFQGSLPQPLIKYDEKGMFGVFTFNPDSLADNFHLVIISKPYIPVVANIKTLGQDYTYTDSSGAFPKAYIKRNYLNYYVDRNIKVIQFLQKQKWVSNKMLVVAGHSEGSTIAAKIASVFPKVTHLIYSGGNPMGRILTTIERLRVVETDKYKGCRNAV